MGIDVIALLDVAQNVVVGRRHPLGLELVVATPGTHFGRSGDEDFEFGVGEHRRADVAAVHHDAFGFAHLLLELRHGFTHKRQGGHRTHLTAHLDGADGFLHAFLAEVGEGQVCRRVEAEIHADVGHLAVQPFGIDAAVGQEEVVALRIEGDSTVHRTTVDVDIAHFARQLFGHRALATRTVAIDGNHDFFHIKVWSLSKKRRGFRPGRSKVSAFFWDRQGEKEKNICSVSTFSLYLRLYSRIIHL